jgi:hypothetical protein
MTLVWLTIGSIAGFLLAQFVINRLAAGDEEAARQAMEQTRVYSREGAMYWMDKAREHEGRAAAMRRIAAWPLKPKEPS